MAITTKHLLNSKYWREPREYSKAEALLYLINRPRNISVRHLAATWQWSKSSVERFIKELKKEKLWDTFWDTFRDTKSADNECILQNIGTQCGTPFGTHNNKNNYYPPILSSTKVESNIIPPKGERDFLQDLDGEYQEIVREWLSYKRERKETYKSVRSMQAFVAKLTKLSQGNPKIAREIINQSIANNWAGIFQLKIDQRNDDNKSNSNRPSSTVFIGNGYGQSTI
jgi:hypothetical protein